MGTYQEIRLVNRQVEELGLNYSKDITYLANGQKDQTIQIIYPNKKKCSIERVYPGIIYQLMDDTETESIYDKVPQLVKFAQRGYVIVLIKNCVEADYQSVIHYLQENAINFNLAKESLFLIRDVNTQVEPASLEEMKELVTRQEDTLVNIKAIISIGNKESYKKLYEDLNLKLPPVLSLFTTEEICHQYVWWNEETFDMMEDFMSNYIE